MRTIDREFISFICFQKQKKKRTCDFADKALAFDISHFHDAGKMSIYLWLFGIEWNVEILTHQRFPLLGRCTLFVHYLYELSVFSEQISHILRSDIDWVLRIQNTK